MNVIEKTTKGCVVQRFDRDTGKCIGQEFIASDSVKYAIDGEVDFRWWPIKFVESLYHSFDMVQPERR